MYLVVVSFVGGDDEDSLTGEKFCGKNLLITVCNSLQQAVTVNICSYMCQQLTYLMQMPAEDKIPHHKKTLL